MAWRPGDKNTPPPQPAVKCLLKLLLLLPQLLGLETCSSIEARGIRKAICLERGARQPVAIFGHCDDQLQLCHHILKSGVWRLRDTVFRQGGQRSVASVLTSLGQDGSDLVAAQRSPASGYQEQVSDPLETMGSFVRMQLTQYFA